MSLQEYTWNLHSSQTNKTFQSFLLNSLRKWFLQLWMERNSQNLNKTLRFDSYGLNHEIKYVENLYQNQKVSWFWRFDLQKKQSWKMHLVQNPCNPLHFIGEKKVDKNWKIFKIFPNQIFPDFSATEIKFYPNFQSSPN